MACACCCLKGRAPFCHHPVKRETTGRTEHPAVVIKTLQMGHNLGFAGLSALFDVGTEWHYESTYENMETHVRVIEHPRQSRTLRDHSLAKWRTLKSGRRECTQEAPRTWFVRCEVVSGPFDSFGVHVSLPPCALVPREAVVWERHTFDLRPREAPTPVELATIRREADSGRWWASDESLACCGCRCICAPVSELDALRTENARLRSENGSLKSQVTNANKKRDDAKGRLLAVQTRMDEALRASRQR